MNIGAVIKTKRQAKDLTQEQLAEYLNVSVSAVSQWESEKTTPDFSMLIPMANFFDITLDELLGRTPGEKEKAIEEYNKKTMQLSNQGKVEEAIGLWREALKKFPGDYHCMSCLASFLHLSICAHHENAEKKAEECVSLCERIVRDCTESEIRSTAIQLLTFLYSYPFLSIANEKKAVKYAEMANSYVFNREHLLEHAYYTEESREKRLKLIHFNRLSYLESLSLSLVYKDGSLKALETAINLWETLIDDGNYLFYHSRLSYIYSCISSKYAEKHIKEKTLDTLEKALIHAREYDSLPMEKQHYTSSFVSAAYYDHSKTTKNYTETDTQLVLGRVEFDNAFDFIRDDPDFLAMVQEYGLV